jgi:predicted aspartyl protease
MILASPLAFTLLALDRGSFLLGVASWTIALATTPGAKEVWTVKLPVENCTGGSYCVRIRVEGSKRTRRIYRAAVDTGSPYLVLSGDRDILYESARPFQLAESPFPSTEEIYGSGSGVLDWKQAKVTFRSIPRLSTHGETILAMMDDQLEVEAGGSLLGLVKHPNPPRQKEFYRPTWLQQLQFQDGSDVRSFSIDQESLTLSNQSLVINRMPRIPLVDLRPLGGFIEHYCFTVKELNLDGVSVTSSSLGGRPIIAVLDTGLTGCLVTQPFWDALTEELNIDPRKIRLAKVRADDETQRKTVEFASGRGYNKMFYVAPIYLDWFYDEQKAPYLVVLGQTFLSQGKLTVDIDGRLATFEL